MAESGGPLALALRLQTCYASGLSSASYVGTGSGIGESGKLTRRNGKTENMASRLELRKMAEAAEARGIVDEKGEKKRKRAAPGTAVKKKAVKKKSRVKAAERRRIVWVIYNSTQKEEDRFAYDQRQAADDRLEVLRSKSKRLYWLQAVKELIGSSAPAVPTPDIYEEPVVAEVEEEEVEVDEEEEEEEEEEEDDDE